MNDPQIDPLETMQTASHATEKAYLRLFLAFDYAVSMGMMNGIIPTSVLLALDHARECTAAMFQYLTAPAVKQVETGPTQDQGANEAYQNGFLSVAECNQLVQEGADNAAPVASVQLLPDGSMIFSDPRLPF